MQGLPHCMYPGSYPGWYHGLHPGVYPVGRNDLIYPGRKLLWTVKFAGTLDGTLAGTMACTVLTSVKPGWQRHLWYQLILIRVIVWTHNQLLCWRCEPFLQTHLPNSVSFLKPGMVGQTVRSGCWLLYWYCVEIRAVYPRYQQWESTFDTFVWEGCSQ